jgi:hypothetical protein
MIDLLRMLAELHRAPPAEGRAPPPGPSLFDLIRLQALIYEESRRIHDLLFDHAIAPAVRETLDGSAPRAGTREEELCDLLRRAQLLLLKHPVAAQAAFTALIAEGRRFAATPEGAEWAAALADSDVVRQGRRVWDAIAMNMLEEDPGTILPSAYLEALLQAARSSDLEGTLRGLYEATKGGLGGAAR